MKAKYTTPVMEVIEFEVEDIITNSGDGNLVKPITPETDETPAIGFPN